MSEHGIQAGNRPAAFAFFDVDETLVTEKTMFTVLHALAARITGLDADALLSRIRRMRGAGIDRAGVNRAFYRGLAGLDRRQVTDIARDYLEGRMKEDGHCPFFIRNSIARLESLRRQRILPVFVSGSASDFLAPVAEYLDVSHVLATQLKTDQAGRYSGEIAGRCMIGEGKTAAVSDFLKTQSANAADCYGFGDHPSDAGFISLLRHGAIIAGNREAENLAGKAGWEIIPKDIQAREVA